MGEASETGGRTSRREFIRLLAAASVVISAGTALNMLRYIGGPTKIEFPPWPRVKVANIKDLTVGKPIRFNYPLEETPNYLIKLGKAVEGGIGPDNDIVAYSAICQHLGCIVEFMPRGHPDNQYKDIDVFYCPCHGGWYNADDKAKVIAGPPLCELPMVKLEYDDSTGDIYAVGMYPPSVYGRAPTPCNPNPEWDKYGGKLVGGE